MKSLVLALLIAAASPSFAAAPPGQVAWVAAQAETDVDQAFVRARAENKPVLLYWGARWCPPCNQLNATLFNRQDFAEQARHLVMVYADGDKPGAQKLGTRFKVRGYPTMIVFSPVGVELTRLAGEADAQQVMASLQDALAGGRPAKLLLSEARAGRALSANEWRMLAYYSWETDEHAQLITARQKPQVLAELAAKAERGGADKASSTRLALKALAASGEAGTPPADVAAGRALLQQVLADPARARQQADVLVNESAEIVRAVAPAAADRATLLPAYDAALVRMQNDATLSRNDRVGALISRVELARADQPQDSTKPRIPDALQQEVRATAQRLDREITDGYERQAVITAAAWALARAGLWGDSDALLQANLAKSHSPYYLMSQLGGNAKRLGRNDDALRWYAQAWEKSEGPATRLQWGSNYVIALVDLAPRDAERIERTSSQLLSEAAKDPASFHERSARSLQRMGGKLNAWNAGGAHAATLKRLRSQADALCKRLPHDDPQRAECDAVFTPRPANAG